MTSTEPGRERRRRYGALLVLVVGLGLAATLLKNTAPQDQLIIFRLPQRSNAVATRLDAQFTPVGQREPVRGLSLAIATPQPREIRQPVRLPDGDYIVAVQLTWDHAVGPSAPAKTETSRSHRVSLAGHETVLVLDVKGLD
jgi:hypothetical protein